MASKGRYIIIKIHFIHKLIETIKGKLKQWQLVSISNFNQLELKG